MGDASDGLDLSVRQAVRRVEQHQDEHLEGGDVELVPAATGEAGLHVSRAHVDLPGQLAPVVRLGVELLEVLAADLQLWREGALGGG